MLVCPDAACGSSNVESVSLFYQSLPAESPLREEYAPPGEVAARYWIALLAVVAGIWLLFSSGVLLGLVVAVGGLLFGAAEYRQVAAFRGAMSAYEARHICRACAKPF
ncbi:hypothetical protein GCM10010129_25320 [Streptomyces fumigatiscleroticus]|nr:hypothetical protein GCM10010129_25320 [Streptomyces fumigatiscleroticus]